MPFTTPKPLLTTLPLHVLKLKSEHREGVFFPTGRWVDILADTRKKRKIEKLGTKAVTLLAVLYSETGWYSRIRALHDLDRTDKHHKLAHIGQGSGGFGITQGHIDVLHISRVVASEWKSLDEEVELFRMITFQGQIQIKPTLNIGFRDIQGFDTKPVTEVLRELIDNVTYTINRFESDA